MFVEIPPGFDEKIGPCEVFRLKKALYGLTQSPRQWFERLAEVMLQMGYKQRKGMICCLINIPREVT